MANIDETKIKLKEEIDFTIKDAEEKINSTDDTKLIKLIDDFLQHANVNNSSKLIQYDTADFFMLFVAAFNYDDEHLYDVEAILDYFKEYRHMINKWQVDKLNELTEIIQLIESDKNFEENYPDKFKKAVINLGFDESVTQYYLTIALHSTLKLIHYKIVFDNKIDKNKIYIEPGKRISFQTASNQKQYLSKVQQTVKEDMQFLINSLREHKRSLSKDKKKYLGAYQSRIKYTKQIANAMEDESLFSMHDIPEEWFDYVHPSVLIYVFSIINYTLTKENHYIDVIKEKLIAEQNKSPFINLLYSEHLDPDYIPKEIIEELENENIDKIKDNYYLLKYIGFNPYEIFIKNKELLINIDPEISKKLTYLVNSNVINKLTFINNPNLLLTDISKMFINYEILKNIIDFNNIYYNGNILFINPLELKKRISILAEYKLLKSNYIFLLCNFNYITIYDLIIENEIPETIFIQICESDNPLYTIKRIKLYKDLNIPYLSSSNTILKEVTNSSKSLSSKTDLDEFYPDTFNNTYNNINGDQIDSIRKHELVAQLDDEYRIDDVYMISNTPISRPKVLKNLQYLVDNNMEIDENIVRCFISNSIIDELEISEIKTILGKKSYKL